MILTSRQLAVVIWLVIFVVWALTVKGVRSSMRSVLMTLLSPKLLTLFTVVIGTNVVIPWLLWREGRWDATMLYDTVLFIAVGAIGSVSRAATQGVTYDGSFFAKTAFSNLGFMVFAGFLMDFFPFGFWVEFLLFVPFVTVLGMLIVVAQYQYSGQPVQRFLTGVQSALGLLLIVYTGWKVTASYAQLMQPGPVMSAALPFVMSLLFAPVLFLACAVFAYEDAFLVVSFKSGDNRQLGRWKKRRLFFRFGLNLPALQRFRRSPLMQDYAWVKTKDEARDTLESWSNPGSSGESESWEEDVG